METKEQKRCSEFNKGTPVRRKWGYYVDHLREDGLVIKTLVIEPNQAISYQKHTKRWEGWLVAQGTGKVIQPNEDTLLVPGESYYIETGEWHSVINLSSTKPLIIVEVQRGECFEDDIVRM